MGSGVGYNSMLVLLVLYTYISQHLLFMFAIIFLLSSLLLLLQLFYTVCKSAKRAFGII